MKTIGLGSVAAAAILFAAAPANAALVETVSVTNTFGYNFVSGGSVAEGEGGEKERVFLAQRAPTPDADLGIDYVGQANADTGSFFFLHNNYCVGACSTASSTRIIFTVTNTGRDAVDVRFDSFITPGHLARVDGVGPARGGFEFTVIQRSPDSDEITTLYSAFGNANDEQLSASGGAGAENGPFNGQTAYEFAGGRVLDWDTTPLNLELGSLAAGATTTVEYFASYSVTSFDDCTDIFQCGGVQVVFGDPRNNGSVRTFARGLGANAIGDPVELINREYDPFIVPFAFNLSTDPLPTLPDGQGPVNYEGTYSPLAVPEPATWMTLILGMGLVGVALRRRRPRAVGMLNPLPN